MFYHRNKQGSILLEVAFPLFWRRAHSYLIVMFFPLRYNNPNPPDPILHGTCAPWCDPLLQQ